MLQLASFRLLFCRESTIHKMKLQKVQTKNGTIALLRSVNPQTNQLLIEFPSGLWLLVENDEVTLVDE
jgi:hypothetical protein